MNRWWNRRLARLKQIELSSFSKVFLVINKINNWENDMYSNLSYGQNELAQTMRVTYDELIDFVTTPEFRAVMEEFGDLPSQERPAFVLSVLLSKEELARRGVHIPDGILIQRSAFGDRRPTLFYVKKYLPDKYSDVWQNVNLTFDNEFLDEDISRAPEVAWRQPLPVHLQAEVMASGGDLEQIP
ncbi:MAG: hypothetical protein HC769_25440 [Cyanobacteria bacterium CRU_2_1]|nr:hypothetical protein [Cyanobacteria bacterium RU_5_0]NJR61879.1 hypothetical protein [Cyanobacteria bacterium CRU_2_1]